MSKPNPQQLEIIRISLLRYINQGEGSIASSWLLQFIHNEGFRSFDQAGLIAELQYLMDKGLIEQVMKLLSPENKRWRLTANGRDFLAEQTGE